MGASVRDNGIVIGVVSDLNDPDRLGRVRVKFPHLQDTESDWARVVAPMAGKERGFYYRPEVGDEMLVLFEHGDPRRPYVVGGLWSVSQKPPADDGKHQENNWRFIHSRSGHVLKFDDTKGKERIELIDKDQSRKIVIDCAGSKIHVQCDQGDVEVESGSGNVSVKAPSGNVTIEAVNVEVKASGSMTLEAAAEMAIKGATVNLEASGPMTIKGATVNIN
ncbi:MAG: phage baseplate assembly protein V [Gemmataceae bacterium]